MKKVILFLISVWILFFVESCSVFNTGKKSEKETTVKESFIKTSNKQKDSTKEILNKVNKAINDNLKIAIDEVRTTDEEFNKKCSAEIDRILSQINVEKSSGENNYQLYYDLERQVLELKLQIAETENRKEVINTNNTETKSSSNESILEKESKKVIKIIPWWVWVILIWIMRRHIIDLIALIFSGVRGIRSISDIFNPPNKN